MKNAELNSHHDSEAGTSRARQPLPPRSQRRFLDDQADDAKSAIIQTLHDMKATLIAATDVRPYARRHPWLVMASALAAGFATGAAVTPSPQTTNGKKQPDSAAESQPACQAGESPQTKQAFLLSTMVTVVGSILQTMVRSWIASAVVAKDQAAARATSFQDSGRPVPAPLSKPDGKA